MTGPAFRYTFEKVSPTDAEETLLLALLAAEALHGDAAVRLGAAHAFDPDRRACVLAADTRAGRDCNRLFVGFLRHEFGPDAFRVERLAPADRAASTP